MCVLKLLMLKKMRIEVEKIKKRPLTLEEDIKASQWDLDSFDVKFIDNIHLLCEFTLAGHEILICGWATTYRLSSCSRCLNDIKQSIKQEFTLSYNTGSLGDYLDLDQDIREEILLNFPMKVLCSPECKGICSSCGTNLNIESCKCEMKA